jgi:hypothetical protein
MSHGQSGFTGVRWSLFIFATLDILLFNIASSALVDGAMRPPPAMTLKLDHSEREAPVTETLNATVNFSGSVSLNYLTIEHSVVSLDSAVDTGWLSSISPSTIIIADTSEHFFNVSVVVPAASLHNITGKLVVKGEIRSGNETFTAEANATITPKAYYGFRLETDKSHFEIAMGDVVFMMFRVYNTGNAANTFEDEIVNLGEVINEHWTITIRGLFPSIAPGEYRIEKITAQSPDDEYFKGDHSIAIVFKVYSVTARNMGEVVNQTLQFTIHVKGNQLVYISPYLVILGLAVAAAYLFCKPEPKPLGKPK